MSKPSERIKEIANDGCIIGPCGKDHTVDAILAYLDEQADVTPVAKEEAWLEMGIYYWFADSEGFIGRSHWANDDTDKSRKAFGNVHRTKEDAQAWADKVRALK